MQTAIIKIFNPSIYEKGHNTYLLRIILMIFLAIWIAGFMVQFVTNIENSFTKFFLSKIYSTVCHQEVSKCISIENNCMMVCARCAGIYTGAMIASVLSVFSITPFISKRLLFFSSLPLSIDVLLTSAGIYPYIHAISFATGIILGTCIYYFILPELESFFSEIKSKKNNE